MNEHERGFIAFLEEPTRRRMETLLGLGEKRRRDVRSLLQHSVRLDHHFAQHLLGREAFPTRVEALLIKKGSPSNCYVLAADENLDGREMSLTTALSAIIGMGNGAFISCIPGTLGFYEFADMKSSYILSR